MKKYFDSKITTLDNGIKIATIKKDTGMFSINLGIKVGALYENASQRGISHLIEHMIFKGTKNRNNDDINEKFEELGAEFNAYTDYEATVYSILALKDEMENCIELISDIIMNSTFNEYELEKERNVILAEIRAIKDDIEDYSFRNVNNYAFKKSPLKYDITGEEDKVRNFTRSEIVEFYNKFYIPNNCYISIVSPFEHEYVIKLIDKYFKSWKCQELKYNEFVIEKNLPIKKVEYKKDIEQSTVTYLYTASNLTEKEKLSLKILIHKLGASSNSMLFKQLREKEGLAYDVYATISSVKDLKMIYIYSSVDKNNISKTEDIIEKCIYNIKNYKVKFDLKTMNTIRKTIKTSVVSMIEDVDELGNYVLSKIIEGKNIYDFDEYIKELKYITEDDIYKICKKVLNNPTIYILTSC